MNLANSYFGEDYKLRRHLCSTFVVKHTFWAEKISVRCNNREGSEKTLIREKLIVLVCHLCLCAAWSFLLF